MNNNFLNSLKTVSNLKETENGATALESTTNKLLDLFGTIGAMRERDAFDIVNSFTEAYAEDKLLAMKMLFYARDTRGGLGEKRVFKLIAGWLADNHKKDIELNLSLIPEYGRWDDLYAFVGTALEKDAFKVLKNQLDKDLKAYENNEPISLLSKWLKSINTSSEVSKKLAKLTAKYFNMSDAEYRKTLSKLRSYTNVVEVKMSANAWSQINYEAVPSYASKNYRNAFCKHDETRYMDYIKKVNNGEAKINAGTLFPYDLVREYGYGWRIKEGKINETIEAQWKALPNYVTDGKKFLVMADTSGSMEGLPMETSVSLAIYFAERNTGAYHGKFITFTNVPRFYDLPDNLSLREKINLVLNPNNVGFDTNLEAAFDLVLDSAIKGKVSQEELPEAILVISDMEINSFGSYGENLTFTAEMKKRFEDAGYKMPVLVYWNVNARNNTFHAEADDNVRFISGSSATIFKGLCEHMGFTALELMLNTLNAPRYEAIKVAE